MAKNVSLICEANEKLSVCTVTCWHHNISMANYSENLINALVKRDVSIKVVTNHCVCKKNYCGSSSLFDGEYCLITMPLILTQPWRPDPGSEASFIAQSGYPWDCSTQRSVKTQMFSITNKVRFSLSGSCPFLLPPTNENAAQGGDDP
jgi:hypothetical protein